MKTLAALLAAAVLALSPAPAHAEDPDLDPCVPVGAVSKVETGLYDGWRKVRVHRVWEAPARVEEQTFTFSGYDFRVFRYLANTDTVPCSETVRVIYTRKTGTTDVWRAYRVSTG